MSLGVCIPDLIEQGKIPKGKAREAQQLYEERLNVYDHDMGDAAAKAAASADVLRHLEIQAAQKKRRVLLQVNAQKQALDNMHSFRGRGGPIDPRAAIALFDRDERARYSNVEARRKAIRGRAHSMIDGILAEHRRTLAGNVRNRAELDEIVGALFGEKTSVNAREMADAWEGASEMLRQRFNAAGGAIAKLERWGLPQSHDSRLVRQAGFETWRDFLLRGGPDGRPLLDRSRMIDDRTGQPFAPDALEKTLREVFETIRTDGWSKATPGAGGAGSLATRRQDHRFLQFADARSWTAYAERFGAGNAFDAMMGHIEGMSRDIALMEILGPNPAATVRWVKDVIQKDAAQDAAPDTKAADRAYAGAASVQRLYDEISGANGRPENRTLALGFSTVRSLQTAAKLGSATLSAVTDLGFQAVTRRFNGLPAAGMIGDIAKLLNPLNDADRRLAVKRGLIAEEWSSMASAQARYLNEELTGEVARRMAEGVLRVSGLSAWTQAGRWAFGMEFLDTLAAARGKSWDNLDPVLRSTLRTYGLDAADWDGIRATPLREERGEQWLFPQDVADGRVGDRLLEMVLSETDFAVPVADLRTRAMFNSLAPRGTLLGEVARSALLFKSFGVSMIITHGRRMLEQQGKWNRAHYFAALFGALTLGGALAAQLSEIARGKDPRPMGDPAFWGAAILKGGGFGIFGDFLSSTENRFGGGLGATLAGPMVQTANNVGDLVVGNARKAIVGEETDIGNDVNRILRQELPGGSIWYTRLAFERLVLDELQQLLDPDFRKSWRRMEKRAEDAGQEYFWAPGDGPADARAPDFSNALEGAPQ